MNSETLAVLLLVAGVAAFLGRALAGYNLSGCLITYVLACLGAVAGWSIQERFFGSDNLIVLPISGTTPVSIIGAAVVAALLAFIGSLLGRPVQRPSRSRSRR